MELFKEIINFFPLYEKDSYKDASYRCRKTFLKMFSHSYHGFLFFLQKFAFRIFFVSVFILFALESN